MELYAYDIKHDMWDYNTEGRTITVDSNGNLINGQHRLHAIIKANKSLKMIINIWNEPATAKSLNFDRNGTRAISYITRNSASYTGIMNFLVYLTGEKKALLLE